MRQPLVETRKLTKVFRDFWLRPRVTALVDLDLRVDAGEILGLLGPNGAGKSTAIKLILGLLRPTRGEIRVFGAPPSDVATKSRVGYLPENTYLYRYLNPRETLDFYGRLFGLDRSTRRRRTEELLELTGMTEAARRPVGEFSKGMQQRVALAQCLINDPEFVVLDEPTSGLDPIGARQVKDLMIELRSRGIGILLCSHILSEVEDVCDRVSICYGGRVRREGTVTELLQGEGRSSEVRTQPRRNLESLFLEIVEEAQAEDLQTAGARAGGTVPDYLGERARRAD